ncbi:MoaD/ThiS family protein [Coprothermobacteraceae bacterium]|nr:MoaD/ThiS family protein [Coprothermobacteraceae bacterium]
MARVRVLLMGGFAELAEAESVFEANSYCELVLRITDKWPQLKAFFLQEGHVKPELLCFLRGRPLFDPNQELRDGDEVSFYPPVTL